MARGGASGGGRSSGGGGFSGGGGRSSGGRIGGSSHNRGGAGGGFGSSRPGGSFGGSPRPGGGYRPPPPRPGGYRPPPPPRYYHRPRRRYVFFGPRIGGYGYGGGGGGGCASLLFIPILLVLVMIIGSVMLFSTSGGYGYGYDYNSYGGGSQVTASTIQREPLPSGSVVETGYYTDELNWIRNQTTLTAGMKNFYKETGVQPYLYLTDNVDGNHSPTGEELDAFANSLYGELFEDEAHLLLVFLEYYEGDYSTWYVAGTQAKAVIDAEAADILLDCIDKYYYYGNLTDDEFFSKAFDEAGERIMNVPTSPWIPVLVVAGVLLVLWLLFAWWKKSKAQKNLEAQQNKEILNTPLETFGGGEAEDLSKKYENGQDNNQ